MAAWKAGHRLKRATVIAGKDYAGYAESVTRLRLTSLDYDNPSASRIGRLHEKVVVLLAGRAAQAEFRPQSVRTHQNASDNEQAMRILERLHSPEELPHVGRYLMARARVLVRQPANRAAIASLAAALVERGTLSGEELGAIIRQTFTRPVTKNHGPTQRQSASS